MENYSVQVPPYTVGPEAYRQIEKQCHIYGKKLLLAVKKRWQPQRINCLPR